MDSEKKISGQGFARVESNTIRDGFTNISGNRGARSLRPRASQEKQSRALEFIFERGTEEVVELSKVKFCLKCEGGGKQ